MIDRINQKDFLNLKMGWIKTRYTPSKLIQEEDLRTYSIY